MMCQDAFQALLGLGCSLRRFETSTWARPTLAVARPGLRHCGVSGDYDPSTTWHAKCRENLRSTKDQAQRRSVSPPCQMSANPGFIVPVAENTNGLVLRRPLESSLGIGSSRPSISPMGKLFCPASGSLWPPNRNKVPPAKPEKAASPSNDVSSVLWSALNGWADPRPPERASSLPKSGGPHVEGSNSCSIVGLESPLPLKM